MIKIVVKKLTKKLTDLVCPPATQDLELNTKNRNAAIEAEHVQYGPLNLSDEQYWEKAAEHWKTTTDVAKKSKCGNCVAFDISPRMKDCMPGSVTEDGQLGYCWMHHFKCHSARTCYTWAAGGPISDDKTSAEWQEKNKGNLEEEDEQYQASNREDREEDAEELGITEKKKKQQKGKKRAKKTAKRKSKKKKDDRGTRIAKRKYDVWPSAYASGAVVKCRQGKIWKGVSESVEDLEDMIREEIINALNEKCWDGYKQVGMKKKGGRNVPNCVPLEESENLKDKIRKALRDEGGAAGMGALEDHTKASKEEIKLAIKGMKDVGLHKDGDYILDDGKEVNVEKPLDEKKKKKKSKTDYSKEKESGLHGWFSRQGGKGKSKGWVDCNTCRKDKKTGKKTCKSCGRKKGEKRAKYPSCRPTPSACGTKGKGKKWGKKK